MSKGFKLSPLLIVAVLCIGLVVYLYLPSEDIRGNRAPSATSVIVYEASNKPFEVVVEALGTAKANESILVTTQTADIIQRIEFDDGDLVKKGQLLLELNDREEKARIDELNVNLQEAKRQLKRVSNLAKQNVASEQLLDEQQARVKVLKAQMNVATTQLGELQVRAPFDGVLGVREVSVGALVRPGDTITTLDDMGNIKVDFNIAESHLPSVSMGQLIRATSIAYPGEIFEGNITSVASRVDPSTRTIQIRANIANQDLRLRPGMLLQINLQKQLISTLVLPEAAVVPVEDKHFVFVVNDGEALRKEIGLGLRKPGIVQVLSGLSVGDVVVIEGALKLRNGSKVNVLNAAEIGE